MGSLAAFRGSFFRKMAQANHPQLTVYAGIDLRVVGRNRLCASGGYNALGSFGTCGHASCAIGLLGDDAGFLRDDIRMPGNAMVGRALWTARRAGIFLYFDDGVYRSHIWKSLLSGSSRPSLVFCLSVLSRIWWRELRRLHALVTGAIPHRVPSERLCLCYFFCAVWRRGDYLPRGRRYTALWIARNSRRRNGFRFRHWIVSDSVRHGDAWAGVAGLKASLGPVPTCYSGCSAEY